MKLFTRARATAGHDTPYRRAGSSSGQPVRIPLSRAGRSSHTGRHVGQKWWTTVIAVHADFTTKYFKVGLANSHVFLYIYIFICLSQIFLAVQKRHSISV